MDTKTDEIHYGPRGPEFTQLIESVLKKGRLRPEFLTMMIDEVSMEKYAQAFTHQTADPQSNYQMFETLGDGTVNNSIIYYIYRRFPQLDCAEGVQVVSRLKINLVSKQVLADCAQNLGFWPFISASEELRKRKMKPLLEDTFEAFCGATVLLLDTRIRRGVGYEICYTIIESLFNQVPISLKYEDVVDAKSRLKELFDHYQKQDSNFGVLKYTDSRDKDQQLVTVNIHWIPPKKDPNVQVREFLTELQNIQYTQRRTLNREAMNQLWENITRPAFNVLLGVGKGALKATASQFASERALVAMAKRGYRKEIPEVYQRFCQF